MSLYQSVFPFNLCYGIQGVPQLKLYIENIGVIIMGTGKPKFSEENMPQLLRIGLLSFNCQRDTSLGKVGVEVIAHWLVVADM
jgi:hypothetical protein